MNLLSILVVASVIGGVCSEVAVSFVTQSYTVQFNETSFQSFWNCLCTTTFECELYLHNQSNIYTLGSIKFNPGNSSYNPYDAFHCSLPGGPSVVCTRVYQMYPAAVNNPDQCQTLTYGNSSSGGDCFPRGLALFWSYQKYTVNTFSPAVENKSNCPEVVAAASATSAPVVDTASVGATTPSSVSIQPTYTPATTQYATTIQSSDAGGAATASNTNSGL